MYCYSKR